MYTPTLVLSFKHQINVPFLTKTKTYKYTPVEALQSSAAKTQLQRQLLMRHYKMVYVSVRLQPRLNQALCYSLLFLTSSNEAR